MVKENAFILVVGVAGLLLTGHTSTVGHAAQLRLPALRESLLLVALPSAPWSTIMPRVQGTGRARKAPPFDSDNVRVLRNDSGLGGKVVWLGGGSSVDLYVFEKDVSLSFSPKGTQFLLVDQAGTANYSVFRVSSDLRPKSLDRCLRRRLPVLSGYSHVYPMVNRWLADDVVEISIEMHGPFDPGATPSRRDVLRVKLSSCPSVD